MMNGARFVGPLIGGALIATLGERWSFRAECGELSGHARGARADALAAAQAMRPRARLEA